MSQTDNSRCVDCGAPIGPDVKNCQYCSAPNAHWREAADPANMETSTETTGPNGSRTVTVTKTSTTTSTTTSSSSSSNAGANMNIDMSGMQDMMKNMRMNMRSGKGFDTDFMNKMSENLDHMMDGVTKMPAATPTVQPVAETPKPAAKGGCLGIILLLAGLLALLHYAMPLQKNKQEIASRSHQSVSLKASSNTGL